MDYCGGGGGSLFVSFNIISILSFESPILDAELGSVPIDVGVALRRRRCLIDHSLTAMGDHMYLDSIGPDEVVRFVKTWAPKAAIRVLSGRGRCLFDWRRGGASANQ